MDCNPRRGEIAARLGGRMWRLCLPLGALAALEEKLGEPGLLALAKRFENGRMSAADILALIGAGLRGAGHDISDEEVSRLVSAAGAPGYVDIAARLLAATFPAPEGEGADGERP